MKSTLYHASTTTGIFNNTCINVFNSYKELYLGLFTQMLRFSLCIEMKIFVRNPVTPELHMKQHNIMSH